MMIWIQPWTMTRASRRAAARTGGSPRAGRTPRGRSGPWRSYAVHELDQAVEGDEGHQGQCYGDEIHARHSVAGAIKRSFRSLIAPYRFRKGVGWSPWKQPSS